MNDWVINQEFHSNGSVKQNENNNNNVGPKTN